MASRQPAVCSNLGRPQSQHVLEAEGEHTASSMSINVRADCSNGSLEDEITRLPNPGTHRMSTVRPLGGCPVMSSPRTTPREYMSDANEMLSAPSISTWQCSNYVAAEYTDA